MSDMKIVELRASNVKRLKAVTIRPDPDGQMVVISGNNGEGKTSILDSIAILLGGKEQIPGKPVRDGEEVAEIVGDLGDIVVTRKISAQGHTSLKVKNKEGATFSSPQQMLNALTGKLAFDPLEFSRMKPKEQAEMLRELLGLDFLEQLRERRGHYEERKLINRGIKKLEGELASIPKPAGGMPPRVDVCGLLSELKAAEDHNRSVEEHGRKLADAKAKLATIERQREKLRQDLRALDAEYASVGEDVVGLVKESANPVDVEPIAEKIRGAGEINDRHDKVEAHKKALEKLDTERAASDRLTQLITDIDADRRKKIAEADMPVDGLGFNEDGLVTMNGLPLDQASAAEQLRVSVAIGIAMNPKLRVLLVRDASLLDNKSMALLAGLASESDCQLWVERIEVDSNTTVVIEDGEVVK